MTKNLEDAMAVIRKYAPDFYPKIGMILGSGMTNLSDQLTDAITIPYQAFGLGGTSTGVPGHASLLVLGYLNGIPVACLKGRLHLYEGVPYESVATLIRVVRHLGAHHLIITAAVGSLHPEVLPGSLMVITDHINHLAGNPLVGPNDESIGPRFLSMANAYDSDLRELLFEAAEKLDIDFYEGVYIATLGPSFETPAEIRAFQILGADVVGMSVVPEVIVARHAGMKVVAITVVTNLAEGLSEEKLTHEATLQYGEIGARLIVRLLPEFVAAIGAEIAST
jgi:xanthosine phosphorylase